MATSVTTRRVKGLPLTWDEVDDNFDYLNSKIVSVKDFGAVGNGVVDDTVAIQAAVAYCYAEQLPLHWPSVCKVSSSITNFHAVQHTGVGGVVNAMDTFYVEPAAQTNTIYVTTAGADTNDGLSSSTAKLTIQSAIDALTNYQDALLNGGVWEINVGVGTFARGRFPDDGLRSKYPIRVIGADVGGHPNVPTTLIKEGATQAAFGLFAQRSTNLYVKDIKFEDFNGSTSSAGISASNRCNIEAVNCHFEDCYIGLSGTEWCELDVKGGIFNDCGYHNSVTAGGYGVRGLFHCKFSIGTQNAGVLTLGPVFTNNYIGVFGQELCTGHVDWCTFTSNNSSGIRLSIHSRVNCDGSSFTSNSTACWATDGSVVSASSNSVFTGNTQNIILGGGSTSSASPVTQNYSGAYGRTDYAVYGSKAPWTVNSLSATILATDTIEAGMLSETYGSSVPPKKIGFRMFGTLAGTAGIKRIQMRLGATALAPITFTAAETGTFQASGELIFRAPSSQVASVQGFRFGGTGSRCSITTATEVLNVDTAVNIEALVGDVADSIVVEYVELFYSGI